MFEPIQDLSLSLTAQVKKNTKDTLTNEGSGVVYESY